MQIWSYIHLQNILHFRGLELLLTAHLAPLLVPHLEQTIQDEVEYFKILFYNFEEAYGGAEDEQANWNLNQWEKKMAAVWIWKSISREVNGDMSHKNIFINIKDYVYVPLCHLFLSMDDLWIAAIEVFYVWIYVCSYLFTALLISLNIWVLKMSFKWVLN